MKVKVAAVQAFNSFGDDEYLNAKYALDYVDTAAAQGARLVVFPEGYPGPYCGPMDSSGKLSETPIESLCKKAKEKGVYIYAGHLEEHEKYKDVYYLCHKLISPEGKILANYRRSHPTHPVANSNFMGGKLHVAPGDEYFVIDTEVGRLGLCICSEIWAPEISRVLMLKGAQIILAPGRGTNVTSRCRLVDNWHCLARARAIENAVYVVMNQTSHEGSGNSGRTAVFGPEFQLGALTSEGVLIVEMDLDRIDQLRNRYLDEEVYSPARSEADIFYIRPGQVYDRRPELYGILTQPMEESFDYKYYEKGLDKYKEEYERVKHFSYWKG